MARKHRLEIKLDPETLAKLKAAAQSRRFTSANAFVRAAVINELRTGETALDRTEQNIAASIDRLAKEVRNLHGTQQATFALTDSLVRLFLSCVPEPPAEALEQAKAKAKLRYGRFIRSVAQGVTSGSFAKLKDLTDHVDGD